MIARDWTSPENRLAAQRGSEVSHVTVRCEDPGYAAAVSAAYRQPQPDIPDDMVRLLAKLD